MTDREPYADEPNWHEPRLTTPYRIGLALLVAVLAAAVGFAAGMIAGWW